MPGTSSVAHGWSLSNDGRNHIAGRLPRPKRSSAQSDSGTENTYRYTTSSTNTGNASMSTLVRRMPWSTARPRHLAATEPRVMPRTSHVIVTMQNNRSVFGAAVATMSVTSRPRRLVPKSPCRYADTRSTNGPRHGLPGWSKHGSSSP